MTDLILKLKVSLYLQRKLLLRILTMLNENSPYLTTTGVCNRYHCDRKTLWRWQQKDINPMPKPAFNPSGSKNLYRIDELEEWEKLLMEQRQSTQQ